QAIELVYGEPCLPDDGAERATVELLVIGPDELGEWVVSTKNDVAAALALHLETGAFKCFDAVVAEDAGEFGHLRSANWRSDKVRKRGSPAKTDVHLSWFSGGPTPLRPSSRTAPPGPEADLPPAPRRRAESPLGCSRWPSRASFPG